jgi:hypothetical protein
MDRKRANLDNAEAKSSAGFDSDASSSPFYYKLTNFELILADTRMPVLGQRHKQTKAGFVDKTWYNASGTSCGSLLPRVSKR